MAVVEYCDRCGEPLDDGRDWVTDIEGVSAHVFCLEEAGVWNRTPTEGDDARDEE